MRCEVCGADAPVKHVSFQQNVGVLVMRFWRRAEGSMCRHCIDATFWRMTLITLFFGWWGVVSFFFTFVILPVNVMTYLGALSLPRAHDPR